MQALSSKLYSMLSQTLEYLHHCKEIREKKFEAMMILFLDKELSVKTKKVITQKVNNKITFSPKSVFLPVILNHCGKIILAHNHPSGAAFPSHNDYVTTLALAEGASLLGIKIIDHLIVTDTDYFSFREAGIL